MLKNYLIGERNFDFVVPGKNVQQTEYTYTIIVGRNGTGKSRLLRSVVTQLINGLVDRNDLDRDERDNLTSEPKGVLNMRWTPSQIICASTSPFDKFPLVRRGRRVEGYNYLGLRGLPSTHLGLAYMGRIIFSLFDAADSSRSQAHAIASVLKYLGYKGEIHARFQILGTNIFRKLLDTNDPQEVLDKFPNQSLHNDLVDILRTLATNDIDSFWKILVAAKSILAISDSPRIINAVVSEEGVDFRCNSTLVNSESMALARAGFLGMREVVLNKEGLDRPIKLHEASSGEQAVVMSLLGIGSHIRDQTLVCIDEPEVCLHPEWQERYIELLFHTFREYRGCHFLIATHSPQIVAQIPEGNCFVMSMEDGEAREAQDYAHRSVDFQLAEVFNAPGFKNEYLSRVALNLFAKASKQKFFDEQSRHELVVLRKAFSGLRLNDPLKELISALEEMVKAYE